MALSFSVPAAGLRADSRSKFYPSFPPESPKSPEKGVARFSDVSLSSDESLPSFSNRSKKEKTHPAIRAAKKINFLWNSCNVKDDTELPNSVSERHDFVPPLVVQSLQSLDSDSEPGKDERKLSGPSSTLRALKSSLQRIGSRGGQSLDDRLERILGA